MWVIIQTTPQGQLRAIDHLQGAGFEVYCPMETVWKRTAKARERINRPLLIGYLFARTAGSPWVASRLDGVRGVIVPNAEAHHVDRYVSVFQKREQAGEFDRTPARRSVFQKGQKAKITAGSFKGHIGEMLEADDEGRVKLMLEGIFKGGIIVDDDHLEAA